MAGVRAVPREEFMNGLFLAGLMAAILKNLFLPKMVA
jgi:hypothetical protein